MDTAGPIPINLAALSAKCDALAKRVDALERRAARDDAVLADLVSELELQPPLAAAYGDHGAAGTVAVGLRVIQGGQNAG